MQCIIPGIYLKYLKVCFKVLDSKSYSPGNCLLQLGVIYFDLKYF